jgi:hypothetical protein
VRKVAYRAERRGNGSPYDGSWNQQKTANGIVRKQQVKTFVEALAQILCKGAKLVTLRAVHDEL